MLRSWQYIILPYICFINIIRNVTNFIHGNCYWHFYILMLLIDLKMVVSSKLLRHVSREMYTDFCSFEF